MWGLSHPIGEGEGDQLLFIPNIHADADADADTCYTGANARPAQENGRELSETQDAHLNHFNANLYVGDADSYWDEAFLPTRAGAL